MEQVHAIRPSVCVRMSDMKRLPVRIHEYAFEITVIRLWTYDIDSLQMHYKAYVRSSEGITAPTEFVHYYAEKIRRTMQNAKTGGASPVFLRAPGMCLH